MRLLIKFGYFGWQFTGFQRGNGVNSIEDCILSVLNREKISDNIQCAARTDRGVSAVSNAFVVDTDRKPSMVLGLLNGKIPDMAFHSYAMVNESFNPRHCDYKTYRYLIQKDEAGPFLRQALKPFRGQHDYRNFCRMDGRNPVRTIRSISIGSRGNRIYIDYKARSFLWNQIRSITAYALEQSFSEKQPDPFSLSEKYPRLMDPEGLILKDMVYEEIDFTEGISISKKKQFKSMLLQQKLRTDVMENFAFLTK